MSVFVLNGFPFYAAMNCTRPLLVGSSILLVALLLLGCGGDDSVSNGGWTVQDGALTLERDLLAGDDEPFYFGEIGDIGVDSDGRIYVADREAGHVKVLSSNGALQDTIGREGKGPGEFERPREVIVARNDSLYVLDTGNRRLSVFTPVEKFARSVQVGYGMYMTLLGADEQGRIILSYTTLPFMTPSGERRFLVRRIGGISDEARDTLLTASPRKLYATERKGRTRRDPIPYTPAPHAAMGPNDQIYFARSDSLVVTSYDLTGKRRATVNIPFDPVAVTEADQNRVQEAVSDVRPIPDEKFPATKPAFSQFLVDDEGRYWFGRYTSHPDTTEWWVAWPDEKRIATTRLSDDVDIEAVRGGYAYGETSTEKGAPALVRYRVRTAE